MLWRIECKWRRSHMRSAPVTGSSEILPCIREAFLILATSTFQKQHKQSAHALAACMASINKRLRGKAASSVHEGKLAQAACCKRHAAPVVTSRDQAMSDRNL